MEAEHGGSLKRTLRVRDLTAFGIAAIIGAGIFGTVGQAAFDGGPAVSLLFVFVAIACGFTAFCYAEFASMIPISGSAYTYAYASFGELIAWIIGWDLLLEYDCDLGLFPPRNLGAFPPYRATPAWNHAQASDAFFYADRYGGDHPLICEAPLAHPGARVADVPVLDDPVGL
jgi:hypothetical protein